MKSTKQGAEWWQGAFNEAYRHVSVSVTSPVRTAFQINFLVSHAGLKRDERILDLACGHGRHAIALAKMGYHVVGFDFAKLSLRKAKRETLRANLSVRWVQGDMRSLPFEAGEFDRVLSLYSSFGYFDDPMDDEVVLGQVARVLKVGGHFLIDYMNSELTIAGILADGKKTARTGLFTRRAQISGPRNEVIVEHQTWHPLAMRLQLDRRWRSRGRLMRHRAWIRLYFFDDFCRMMGRVGLKPAKVWGDFDGSPFTANSPRLIIRARRVDEA